MENQKAISTKTKVSRCWLLVLALLILGGGLYLMGFESGRAEGREAMAAQHLPASPQIAPEPLTTPAGPDEGYTLNGVFLHGNQIAGETSFSPSEIVAGECRLTEIGQQAESMTLFQDLGSQTGRTNALLKAYATNSVIQLSNTRLVSGDKPYIVSDARIVPQGVTAPFPAYLEVKQAIFKWALPVTDSVNSGSVGDPLIVCNYA